MSTQGVHPLTDKALLRARFARIRESMSSPDVRAASAAVCGRLATWPALQRAGIVMTYLAFRNEIDLSALCRLLPRIRWVAPRIEKRRLVLHRYDPARLVRHRFGMLEPAADLPTFSPGEVDVVLVPGVAFDRHGTRLGFGGGFYDRFLPTSPALRVGVTYDPCLVDALPHDGRDQNVHWVVTPTQMVDCRTPASGQA